MKSEARRLLSSTIGVVRKSVRQISGAANCEKTDEWRIEECTLFLRDYGVHKSTPKLFVAALFGQQVVVDFDFESKMSAADLRRTVDEVCTFLSINQKSRNPFDVWFCNLKARSKTEALLKRAMPSLYAPTSLTNVTYKSYLQLFAKEKVIYLSSDAEEALQKYDHDAVYIIGAHFGHKSVVFSKAVTENVRIARLPVDEYLSRSNVDLTFPELLNVLQTIRMTSDWSEAFKHVDSERLQTEEDTERIAKQLVDASRTQLWKMKKNAQWPT